MKKWWEGSKGTPCQLRGERYGRQGRCLLLATALRTMRVPRRIAATSPLVIEEALVEGGIGTLETLAYGGTRR